MARVLLTGFGPFPGASINPSAWLAETLPERVQDINGELHARVLPTEWTQVARLAPLLHETLQPHVTIHFGLSQRARGLRIERSAHNRASPRADAAGARPSSRVISSRGPARRDTSLPADALAAALRQRGIAAELSRSAGRYLCNFLYYLSLHHAAQRDGSAIVLFVHIPPGASDGGPMSESTLLDGAETILRFALARVSKEVEPFTSPIEGEGARPLVAATDGAGVTR
jgi:pyroglutamyl-peptidase